MPIAGRAKALEALILGAFCAGLAACATDGGEDAPAPGNETAPPAAAEAAPVSGPIGVLAPRDLDDGECGLFLYSRRAAPQFIFYAQDGAGIARMNLDSAEVSLTRKDAARRDLAAEQAYQGENGLRVELNLEIGEALTGGIRIPAGSLRLSQPDGWDLVVPVTGLTACQAE